MQTLVVRIPDDLAADIEAEARRLNSTKSAVARARLSARPSPAEESKSGYDLIADLVGTNVGGPRDLSARKKHYLKLTGFGRDRPPR
jgi:hypothetical protein